MTQIIHRRCYFPSTHADGAPLLPHTGAHSAPFGWRSTAIAGLHASDAQLEAAADGASSSKVNQNVDPRVAHRHMRLAILSLLYHDRHRLVCLGVFECVA
jgi:hypothetical protein